MKKKYEKIYRKTSSIRVKIIFNVTVISVLHTDMDECKLLNIPTFGLCLIYTNGTSEIA